MTTDNQADFRTPLARARGLGSAHSGLHHWLLQRFTAVALVPMAFWFVRSMMGLVLANATRADIVAWMQSPWNAIPLILFTIVGIWHGTLGMQVVAEDYIHCKGLRFCMIVTIRCLLVLLVTATVYAILSMSFHGAAA